MNKLSDSFIQGFKDLKRKFAELKSSDFFEIGEKNAVFDLDNTLLTGDIGDSLFSYLLEKKIPLNLSWKEYKEIIENEGKEIAYSKVVSVMAGLSVSYIEELTSEILKFKKKYIEVENQKIPVPRVNKLMSKFIDFLRKEDFNIYIISATNTFTVSFTGNYLFDIPKENCFGIESETYISKNKERILSDKIIEPLTVSTGKAFIYNDRISKVKPLITAGDSETDIYLLNLVDSRGFSLWVGDDLKRYETIRKKSKVPDRFFYLRRV